MNLDESPDRLRSNVARRAWAAYQLTEEETAQCLR